MKLIVFNLEKMMQNTLFLETEAGKLTIADTFSTSQQLFIVIFQANTCIQWHLYFSH